MIRTFSSSRLSTRFVTGCILGFTAISPAIVCAAQELPSPPQHPLQSATELVKIETSVLDESGNFVGGLTQSSFQVLDAGVGQPIIFFAPVEAPAQVLVLLETSPAVYLISDQHLAAAYALLEGLAPDDEVALVTYDVAPRPVLAFTADKSAFAAALGEAQYTLGMGDLNFYDSLSTALDWLSPVTGKKAIVVISTGLDSSPPGHWESLVRKIRGEDVVIFSVVLGSALREAPAKKSKPRKSPSAGGSSDSDLAAQKISEAEFAKAGDALHTLATLTGGRAYFPQSEKDFATIYREVAVALRHEYVLGIAPAHDNQFHALNVEVLGGSGQPDTKQSSKQRYRILSRTGYLAPAP